MGKGPRFAPAMDEVRATTRIFGRGEYELEIKNISVFIRTKQDGSGISAGATVFAKMIGQYNSAGELDEAFAGEDVAPIRCYVHSDGAQKMTKQFVMPALGYSEEEEFNTAYPGAEPFSVDGEDDEKDSWKAGSGWANLKGKRVRVTLDKGEYRGEEQQDFRNWLPV